MADPAIAQVEDMLQATLAAWPGLTGWAVVTDRRLDEALSEEEGNTVLIYTVQYQTICALESGQTEHKAVIEFEAVSHTPTIGTISRANHTALAHIAAAIAASGRTLNGRIQWIEEVDVAPAEPRGKDVGGASLQMQATFFTPHDDWFSIVV